MPHLCKSFPFVASPKAMVLILGSMPGKKSLEAQQYYAHPQNIFWEIMGNIFGARRQLQYKKRLQILKENGIALWDVAGQCERKGSLDTNIQAATVVPNDFKVLFTKSPHIHSVFFNGHKAEQLFRRLVLKHWENGVRKFKYQRLPSTSPAYTSLSRKQKQAEWKRMLTSFKSST